MLPKGVRDKIQGDVGKPCFWKSPSSRENWKSKSMRIIPEEFVKKTSGAFEHRVVFSDRWENSWQLWLDRDKKDLFMIEEDWNEFVDDNLLGPTDSLLIIHDDTMFLDVKIFKNDGNEIISLPSEVEPETEPLHPEHQDFHKETTTASASASVSGTDGQARKGCGDVKNPERYLLNPKNPYFVKTLTKKNDVLYMRKPVIKEYGLKFGPSNSPMTYLLPGEKFDGYTKVYGGIPCFNGWVDVCRKYNLKTGDSVVCELERSKGVVTAVRVHLLKE